MSLDHDTLTESALPPAPIAAPPAPSNPHRFHRPPFLRRHTSRRRVRLRKLRLLLIVLAFGALALISAVFGMLMSVASDLPQLENVAQFKSDAESYMYDDTGKPIGPIAPPTQQVVDQWKQISHNMVNAIIAVEDRRFWSDPGIDLKGIARAFVSDVTGGPREGASTITEQFVKNAEEEQDHRTIFEKLREAALAFQLVHRWKLTQILTSYLNTIYFGNGAVGIESAARVYFGWAHGYSAADPAGEPPGACGDPTPTDPHRPECAEELTPAQAALLAGMVASPTEFDPILHRGAATQRRNLVLQDMLAQHFISRREYERSIAQLLPTASQIQQPQEPAAAPYFTSWVRPQIVAALEKEGVPDKVAQYRAYYGGLKVRLTINLKLQEAAQAAVDAEFPPGSNGPTASLVAIDNRTGEVRAMVSGDGDYAQTPFNLATMGHRQPGSAFKLFTLAAALTSGEYGPDSVIDSAPQDIPFHVPHGGTGHFIVHNFGNTYSGPITLSEATAISDNSVFAQVGMHVGTKHIEHYAKAMGIRSPVSTNPSMILGGLNTGVSALDMAHAYETVATGGLKVYNPTLGAAGHGAIGIHSILCPVCSQHYIVNRPVRHRVLSASVAATIHTLLEGPVSPGGTAPSAAIPGVDVAGKTGTTSNYVDAWFIGWTPQLTTAVWVGYPNRAIPMLTNYNGSPVEGGTFPAVIWHDFMVQALQILASEQSPGSTTLTTPTPALSAPSGPATTTPAVPTTPATTPATPARTTPSTAGGGTGPGTGGGAGGGGGATTTPAGTGGGTSGGAGTGGAAPGG